MFYWIFFVLFSGALKSPDEGLFLFSVSATSLNKPSLSPKPFPIIHRPEVQRWIDVFSKNPSPYMLIWLKRSYRYFPLMENVFESQGLPRELLAMSLVESSLSPHAVSSAQAVGYWQFIKGTGKDFGLQVNDWIDERKDFQKSTEAAGKYLFQLYQEFQDWLLCMSAYNMGEARLRALIAKYQSTDFWTLYKKPDFPKETALYVPKVLAAVHLIKNPAKYGLNEFPVLSPYKYDVFFTPGGTNLKELSSGAQISFSEIKTLNPDLKKHRIPLQVRRHPIRIPKGSGEMISRWLDKQKKAH